MQKRTVEFAVTKKNGVVQRVGRSFIEHPKTNYKGGSINWLADKPKKRGANNDR